jgi:hypothetical protein
MATKERLLKKYEGVARPWVADAGDPPMEFYSPFGPMIAKTRMPDALLARINRYADGLATPGKGMEFLLPGGLVMEGGEGSLARFTTAAIRRYLTGLENTTEASVDFEVFWVISQYAGTPSPVHFHSADISGVLYLKVPEIETAEESKTYISGRHAGYINFLIGGKQRFSKSLISFKPKVGDFYIFPGWLLHGAEPFRGDGERRSMSFNAVVGGEG